MDQRIARHPPARFAKIDIDAWTAPFWEAASRRELCLPRCSDCGAWRMPPTPFCPECRSQALDWSHYTGRAELYSYTVVDRAIVEGMEDSLPYVPAIVAFPDAQGIRLISNIVDCRIGDLRIGAALALAWLEPALDVILPAFSLLPQPAGEPS